MKTKTLLTLLAAFCISISTFANSNETIKFSNIEQNENGCVKEFVYCDKETNSPISKTVYKYDIDGRMQEKANYEWDSYKGWVGIQKIEYSYNNNQQAVPVIFKWNSRKNDWNNK